MHFDAYTMRTLHRRVMPHLDTVTYKGERVYWYTRRTNLGTRGMQDMEAILYGDLDIAARKAIKVLKEYIELDKIIEVLVLHKTFGAVSDRIRELGDLLSEVGTTLNDRPIKKKRLTRSAIPDLYAMLCLYRDMYDELVHPVTSDIDWERYRREDDTVIQTLDLPVDILELLRELA